MNLQEKQEQPIKKKLSLSSKPFQSQPEPQLTQPIKKEKPQKKIDEKEELEKLEQMEQKAKMANFWVYEDFLRRTKGQREKLEQNLNQKIQVEQLRLRKRQQKRQKCKQACTKLAKIGKIVFELRQARGQILGKEKKKQYKFAVTEEGNVEIVEKEKKKKLSKIKRAKQTYKEQYDNDLAQLINENDEFETENSSSEDENQEEENIDQADEEQKSSKSNNQAHKDQAKLSQIIFQISQNPYCQERYKNMIVRGWVHHILDPVLDEKALQLINALALMQAKKKVLEPKKFKKRIVSGFNEVKRTITTSLPEKLTKMIILPVNIIENPIVDGSDDKVLEIIRLAYNKGIPIVHASNKSKIARAFCGKFGTKMSAISIINFQGQDELFKEVLSIQEIKMREYQSRGLPNMIESIIL